jgi:UDP-GlcNAc:undecaprenyl-phosphate/decaprenyl-phosphate GlcNAc-1-phosphate transferase
MARRPIVVGEPFPPLSSPRAEATTSVRFDPSVTSLTTLILAASFAALISAAVRRLPVLTAMPLPDRWHKTATPLTGGIAIFMAFIVALQPALFSDAVDPRYVPVILGAAAAFGLGLWDDGRAIGPKTKFAGQCMIAIAAAVGGVRPDWLPLWVGIPVAALILVGAMNSLNLLDHMDGLAAGTAAIAALGLAVVGGLVADAGSPVVAAALAGACLGFMPFNYRPRRPAALFMGDSGSHLLGFTLGALALLASPGGAGGAAVALAAPLLILALPLLDTGLVTIVRFAEGRPIWQGGRDHSSHRLVYDGLTERRAVALLLGVAANCTITAIAVVIFDDLLLTAIAAGTTLAMLVGFAARLAIISENEAGGLVTLIRSAAARLEDVDAKSG